MNRFKTLSLPLASLLAAASVSSVDAQVQFALSSQKSFRQSTKGVKFLGGSFDAAMSDGHITTIGVCNSAGYYPPGTYVGACAPGTSGFISSGSVNGADFQRPYLLVTELQSAIAIEPFAAKEVFLNAAPASLLQRPSGGFKDDSVTLYYNLTTASISQYSVTGYSLHRDYAKNQRDRSDGEIVPGVYHYSFPRLGYPNLSQPVTAVIYPMIEGLQKIGNRDSGFKFTSVNNNKWVKKNQFVELSYLLPNTITWSGLTSSSVYVGVDELYFSMRALNNPKRPGSTNVFRGNSIFPAFVDTATESRILLRNPLVSTFTTPPVLPSGTRAMVEVEVQRNFRTSGVAYDFSNRRFQIPVIVIDRYKEYKKITLSKSQKKNILEDSDNDGFNNLNEWILDSDASYAGSIPRAPIPEPYQKVDDEGAPTPFGSYFGFNINLKQGTVPKVKYILQRSRDNGKTWERFRYGYYDIDGNYAGQDQPGLQFNWSVTKVRQVERGITTVQIQVRSGIFNPNLDATIPFIPPPRTAGDIYRVKIVLAKKKK